MQAGVFQATHFELYTPSNNILPYAWVTFYIPQDCTLSITDKNGHDENTVPFVAGYYPILVTKIRAISAGVVYIMAHNELR